MAKQGRRATVYVELADSIATKSIPEAKMDISIQVLMPPGYEKKSLDFIDDMYETLAKEFKKQVKKWNKKAEGSD